MPTPSTQTTVSLSAQTAEKARRLAEKRAISLSELVEEQLATLISREEQYEDARHASAVMMESGFHLGGGPYARREDVHER
jgi:predicted transcriptional regulator